VSTFLEGEYDIDLASTPATILDLGSHAGATIIYFRHRFPSARIVGVEPSPRTFRRLRHNTDKLTDVELVEGAVVPHDGSFYITEGKMSTSATVAGQPTDDTVPVDGISLETIRSQHGLTQIDLLKVDIEGSEWEVFRGPADVQGINTIVGELHTDAGRDTTAFFARFPEFSGKVLCSHHSHAEIFLLTRSGLR
jgi:FkbM family methyltransferase